MKVGSSVKSLFTDDVFVVVAEVVVALVVGVVATRHRANFE